MIRGLSSTGNYTIIAGGAPATPYISNGGLGAGNVRFNTNTQYMEVYDGHSWLQLASSYASVGLTPEAERLLDWAKRKLNEESALELKAKDNPAIADLLKQRNTIDEQIKVIEILTKDNKVGTN
jgi:hypothetical protein